MSILSVVTIDPELLILKGVVLREQSTELNVKDPSVLEICKKVALEMFDLMYSSDGAGLAAPQVGIPLRLVVMDPSSFDFGPHVLINPEIFYMSSDEEAGFEGCLSLPRQSGSVMRASEVHVRAYNLKGEIEEYQAKGWVARVFQHEVDHLNGMLYPDRMKSEDKLIAVPSGYRRQAIKAIENLSK